MKVWTLEKQNAWNRNYIGPLRIGTVVKLNRKTFTGNDDRLNLTATITGIEKRAIEYGHIALKLGFDTEEIYKVKYSDGKTSVLWPDEIDGLE